MYAQLRPHNEECIRYVVEIEWTDFEVIMQQFYVYDNDWTNWYEAYIPYRDVRKWDLDRRVENDDDYED